MGLDELKKDRAVRNEVGFTGSGSMANPKDLPRPLDAHAGQYGDTFTKWMEGNSSMTYDYLDFDNKIKNEKKHKATCLANKKKRKKKNKPKRKKK